MKVTIFLPNELLRRVDAAARRLGLSQSELYVAAIAQFADSQQTSAVTERLNEIYTRRPAKIDQALNRAQLKAIERDAY